MDLEIDFLATIMYPCMLNLIIITIKVKKYSIPCQTFIETSLWYLIKLRSKQKKNSLVYINRVISITWGSALKKHN